MNRSLCMTCSLNLTKITFCCHENAVTREDCILRHLGQSVWRAGGLLRTTKKKGSATKTWQQTPVSIGAGEMNRTPDLLITDDGKTVFAFVDSHIYNQ